MEAGCFFLQIKKELKATCNVQYFTHLFHEVISSIYRISGANFSIFLVTGEQQELVYFMQYNKCIEWMWIKTFCPE